MDLPGELRPGRNLQLQAGQKPLPGELRVFTTPPGAEVWLNGENTGQNTPATLRTLPSEQEHRVAVRLKGFRRTEQTLTLKPKEIRTLNLPDLAAAAGTVRPVVTPMEAAGPALTFSVDERPATLEGGQVRDVEPGTRRLAAAHPDYEPWSGTAEVKDGETTSVEVALKPKPGRVAFATTPPGATVRVSGGELKEEAAFTDAEKKESLTPFTGQLPPGDYTVVYRLAGHQSASRPIKVGPNQSQELAVTLERQKGPQAGQAWTVPELGLELIPIAAGSFRMGSESGASDEKPVTNVRISRTYWLGKYEVTQAEWQALMGSEPSSFKGARLPVEQVSWDDVMGYCRKLTERERAAGRLPEGYVYTLPTEAEWEYACRAGTTGDYAGDLDSLAWYGANSGNRTHEVGTKRANAWGLHDMHGNVWEWCRDWYASSLAGGSVTDPTGAASGSNRVLRGGCWGNVAANCRSANRLWNTPDYRDSLLGFRVALSSGSGLGN